MKKLLIILLTLIMTVPSYGAEANVNIVVYGKQIESKGYIIDGRTLVPLRGIFEEMGYDVTYDVNTKTATLTKLSTTMSFRDGDSFFTLNGGKIELEVPQQIIDGHFVIPIRAITEVTANKADWDADTKTVTISQNNSGITMSINNEYEMVEKPAEEITDIGID